MSATDSRRLQVSQGRPGHRYRLKEQVQLLGRFAVEGLECKALVA